MVLRIAMSEAKEISVLLSGRWTLKKERLLLGKEEGEEVDEGKESEALYREANIRKPYEGRNEHTAHIDMHSRNKSKQYSEA